MPITDYDQLAPTTAGGAGATAEKQNSKIENEIKNEISNSNSKTEIENQKSKTENENSNSKNENGNRNPKSNSSKSDSGKPKTEISKTENPKTENGSPENVLSVFQNPNLKKLENRELELPSAGDEPKSCPTCNSLTARWRPFPVAPWSCVDCDPPRDNSVCRHWRIAVDTCLGLCWLEGGK